MDKYGGQLIFSCSDGDGVIEVIEKNSFRSMHFGTPFPQSTMEKQNPYRLSLEYSRIAMLSLLFIPSPTKTLVLGFGGGSIPKFLWKFFPKCTIDSVECRSSVVAVAKQYFSIPESKRFHIYVDDAEKFLMKSSEAYDLIFVDLFSENTATNLIGDQGFCLQCVERVRNGGLAIVNVWGSISKENMLGCVQALHSAFGNNVLVLPVEGTTNLLFFLFREPLEEISSKELTLRALRLQKKTQLDFLSLLDKVQRFKNHGFVYQSFS